MGQVGRRGPLRGAGDIGRLLSGRKFDSDGDIEVVENLEAAAHGRLTRRLTGRRGLIEGRPHEARRRSDVARQPQHAAARPEGGQRHGVE